MPARHTSLQDDLLFEASFRQRALVDERGCRRDIRSNGRTIVSRSSLFGKPVRQKKQVFFVRCEPSGSQFHRQSPAQVKSGPDVFADALVPLGRRSQRLARAQLPNNPDCQIAPGSRAGAFCANWADLPGIRAPLPAGDDIGSAGRRIVTRPDGTALRGSLRWLSVREIAG